MFQRAPSSSTVIPRLRSPVEIMRRGPSPLLASARWIPLLIRHLLVERAGEGAVAVTARNVYEVEEISRSRMDRRLDAGETWTGNRPRRPARLSVCVVR